MRLQLCSLFLGLIEFVKGFQIAGTRKFPFKNYTATLLGEGPITDLRNDFGEELSFFSLAQFLDSFFDPFKLHHQSPMTLKRRTRKYFMNTELLWRFNRLTPQSVDIAVR